MSFIDKAKKQLGITNPKDTPYVAPDPFADLNSFSEDIKRTVQQSEEILNQTTKNIQNTTRSIQTLSEETNAIRNRIKQEAAGDPELNSVVNKTGSPTPASGSSFVRNHVKETGENMNKTDNGSNGDFGETQNTANDEVDAEEEKKVVEPLLQRKTIIGLGNRLKESVFGQDQVIETIEDGLVVGTVRLNLNPDKPAGCYLFAGPSGVGKTELSIQLSKQLDVPILVVNMGELALEQDVTKLIGVASGYVGYANGGLLTNFVRENPRCVIVFDELEKAHVSINKILLSIMDKGVCRDNKNREVFFKETVFIATTNLGADVEYITDLTPEEKFEYRMGIIKEKLAPEIINRYDNIFQFNSLSTTIYESIIRKFIKSLNDISVKNNGYEIKSSEAIIKFAAKHSYDPAMGGRPALRFIQQIILKPLAYKLLDEDFNNKIIEAGSITLDMKGENIVVKLGKKIVSTLENTQQLLVEYNKGKFTNKSEETVTEEIDPDLIPKNDVVPELQLENTVEETKNDDNEDKK